MSALFACTKCAKRFPFEHLSEADQLCKECRNNFPIVKCTYCRVEFQQEDKESVNTICRKCAHNVKAYGKPRACEYCSIIAAFIGNRCQRCANSEKKWGPPKTCDQCKQQCAFQRGSDSRLKLQEGKHLCWLCTMASKRVLAKALRNTSDLGGTPTRTPTGSRTATPQDHTPYSPGSAPYSPGSDPPLQNSGRSGGKSEGGGDASSNATGKDKNKENKSRLSASASSTSNRESSNSSKPGTDKRKSEPDKTTDNSSGDTKRPKLEKSATGSTSAPGKGGTGSSSGDINSSETMVIITQLKEELESVKKQLAGKDNQIRDRDKKLTELKADNFAAESNMRTKIAAIQKLNQEQQQALQGKNRELQRQVAQLQKKVPKKASVVSAAAAADS